MIWFCDLLKELVRIQQAKQLVCNFMDALGIQYPTIQAPLTGDTNTHGLVFAVSNSLAHYDIVLFITVVGWNLSQGHKAWH